MAPDSLPEPIAAATLVADVLDRIGVPYVIGGSFASSVHGEPRSTNDVDMVADLHEPDIDRFIQGVEPRCYVSREMVIDAVREGGTFNVIEVSSAVKIDIFVAGSDAFDHERLRRRIVVRLSSGAGPPALFVDTAEDTILRKLEWYRRGGESSERQWRDVLGIVNAQRPKLDQQFLRDWAARLGVSDLLELALK